MSSGSNSLTTYYAKRIIGDTAAANAPSALLQTGTGIDTNTWILNRTNRVSTYGIKYVYDSSTSTVEEEGQEPVTVNNGHDKIEFHGGGANASAWVQLDTGDAYILGNLGVGTDPSNSSFKLSVNGSAYFADHIYIERNNKAKAIIFQQYGSGARIGVIKYDSGDATNVTSGQFTFAEYSPKSTPDTSSTGYRENYTLPVCTAGLSADATYNILNTKENASPAIGTANYVAYYSATGTISDGKSSTSMIMPGHYYHNLYNDNPTTGTTVYVHYYNSGTTSTNTSANFRVKSGTSYKTLAFGGDGNMSWEGGLSLTNGLQFPTSGGTGNARTTNWISAGNGYSTGSGKSGVKLICCEQSDCLSGLGQDCGGGPYELSVITGQNPSAATTAYIRFLRHDKTSTTYTQLAEINGSGTLTVGYRVTSTAPSSLTSIDRIVITPYFHTGGPWKITSRDDSTNSYLALYYGSTEVLRVKHDGVFQTPLKTSFKGGTAMCSYGSSQTTVPNLLGELRYSNGATGSANLSAYTTTAGGNLTAGWYNFFYSPHRSGGLNGAATGDNHSYGCCILGGMTVGSNLYYVRYASNAIAESRRIWMAGNAVTGAVWNDYAEYRSSKENKAGQVLYELGDDTLAPTTERMQHFAGVASDTWGFAQGETSTAKTPIAVSGRVLVYTYQSRENYKPGDCVCAAPNGTVDIMTRSEVIQYPDRIVGTVSCIPDYKEWGGGPAADRPSVKVNGRIWIKVR